ncbi:MAG: outer membrane protein transport protein [Bacteroidota bacterium]|nr:outer membrane protein transport protein [Bacteroidota bacterium]
MKRLLYSIILTIFATGVLYAQDARDALRLSFYNVNGTARSAGMGNAIGALGGDFASLSINPAGSAIYRSTEFSFTPSLSYHNANATFEGNRSNDTKYMLNFSQFGLVTGIPVNNNESGIISVNFGIGYNRLADFNRNFMVGTPSANSTILDYFTQYANQIGNPDQFDGYNEGLAWRANLINYDSNSPQGQQYWNDIQNNGYKQSLTRSINTSGGIDEYVFNIGTNINHRIYLGATIGVQNVYYKETFMHSEVDENGTIDFFNSLDYSGYNKTTGSGVNIKLGAIFRPVDNLRLGIAFHSPTFYDLHDTYDRTMQSSVNDNAGVAVISNVMPDYVGEYDYKLETPLKLVLSGSYLFGKEGLISVDYEYTDYSTMKLRSGGDGYDFKNENNDISNIYGATQNLRIGGEYRPLDFLALRAGIELIGNPYRSTAFNASQPNKNFSYTNYAVGFGIRQSSYFFDIAYKLTDSKEYNALYPGGSMTKYNVNSNQLLFTLGFKF